METVDGSDNLRALYKQKFSGVTVLWPDGLLQFLKVHRNGGNYVFTAFPYTEVNNFFSRIYHKEIKTSDHFYQHNENCSEIKLLILCFRLFGGDSTC